MYLQHFGLREAPFGVASDWRFTFFGKEHREAISSLYIGILEGRGISTIVARPGMGKTTLTNYLLARLRTKAVTCRLDYPFRERSDLMCGILSELGLDSNEDRDFRQVKMLETFCAQRAQKGLKTVLFFDEAQALSLESLEQIRLLSNLRLRGKAAVEIVLAGHPCLADAIRSPELESLRQRIGVLTQIPPLDEESVRDYVAFRLKAAGQEKPLFTADALRAAASLTSGIPRNVNHLCHSAMLLACAQDHAQVSRESVLEAARELQLGAEFANDEPAPPDGGWGPAMPSWAEPTSQPNGRGPLAARHLPLEEAARWNRIETNRAPASAPRRPAAAIPQTQATAQRAPRGVNASLSGIERATENTAGGRPAGPPGWPAAHASAPRQPHEEQAASAAVLDPNAAPTAIAPTASYPDVWSSYLLPSFPTDEITPAPSDQRKSGKEDSDRR